MMTAGALAVGAEEYDISVGSISVELDEAGIQRVTQQNYCENKADDDVVVKGINTKNTVTVDAGAKITLDHPVIYDGSDGDNDNVAVVTVTDKQNTGKTATIVMKDSQINGDSYDTGRSYTTAGVVVGEGASLELQVAGNNKIFGGDNQRDISDEKAGASPGIQLENGASLTISDYNEEGCDSGELLVQSGGNWGDRSIAASAAIGTKNGSDASVTITINENNDLSLRAYAWYGETSGAAIGTGANSTGNVTVNMNGGVIRAGYYGNADGDAIGLGDGASGEKNLYVNGDPQVSAFKNIPSLRDQDQIITVVSEDKSYVFVINDPDWYFDVYTQYSDDAEALIAKLTENDEASGGAKVRQLDPAPDPVPDEPADDEPTEPAGTDPEEPADADPEEPADTEPEEPADAEQEKPADVKMKYISAGNFAVSFVSAAGQYLPEIRELKGSTDKETFDNFKEYAEKNKLFDTESLTAGTKLTAGQIAAVFCNAAGLGLSGSDKLTAALEKVSEKGILKNYKADSKVPVAAAKKAIDQYVKTYLADK